MSHCPRASIDCRPFVLVACASLHFAFHKTSTPRRDALHHESQEAFLQSPFKDAHSESEKEPSSATSLPCTNARLFSRRRRVIATTKNTPSTPKTRDSVRTLSTMTHEIQWTRRTLKSWVGLLKPGIHFLQRETTASDMMKCLNTLRIQDISVTNSTPTPSAASVPRLAPPPLSSRGSVQSTSTEAVQTWPNIQIRSESVPGHVTRKSDGMSPRRASEKTQGPTEWVAFTSPFQDTAKEKPSNGVEVHANSAAVGSPPESFKSPSVRTDSIKSEEIAMTENNSQLPPPPPDTEPPVAGASTWEAFGDSAFPSSSTQTSTQEAVQTMETLKEEHSPPHAEKQQQHRPLRPPPKPPIMRTQKTGSSTRSNDVGTEAIKAPLRSPWVDSDDDAISLPQENPVEHNPFAAPTLSKRKSSGCSLASKGGDALFQSVLTKHGAPQLELVETVNACFSGNELTRYTVWGEVVFKLSGSPKPATDTAPRLSSHVLECLEFYHLVLRLKCVLQHVFLKHVIAKKSLMEWNDQPPRISRQSSLTMNEARKGLVESKVMHWNLARCYQEALSAPVTLLRYPVQPKSLAGPPLKVQVQWQRPRKSGQPVLVDIALTPNRCLATSLWGVTVCLKGFGESAAGAEALACPEARWNAADGTFEWSIPMINPDDAVQHLKVKVTEKPENPCPDYHLATAVKFVMPHATLSGTLLLGWLERKDASPTEPLFGEEASVQEPDLIFCENMCLSGNYEADVNYGSK